MALSQMMQQYLRIKEQYPDCILMFRLGDFYEMFFEDARTVSRELELVLTGKDCGLEERAPMCGVPFHAAENYITRLISKGYRVAVCEQLEDPSTAKKIVDRGVVRVISPGTVTEGDFLRDDRNNFICSVICRDGRYGVAYADVTTGYLTASDMPEKDSRSALMSSLTSYYPSEIITDGTLDGSVIDYLKSRFSTTVTTVGSSFFEEENAKREVASISREDDGAERGGLSVCAAGALIAYIKKTQKNSLSYFRALSFRSEGRYLSMDAFTKHSLELTETMIGRDKRGSLLGTMDFTETAPGARLLRKWILNPLMDIGEIKKRQDAVEELKNRTVDRKELAHTLSRISDIERLTTRLVYNTAGPNELKQLELSLRLIPDIKAKLSSMECATLCALDDGLETLGEIAQSIGKTIAEKPAATIREGGFIKDGANNTVDELRAILKDGKSWIAGVEQIEREKTGIRSLKVGYNKVFGYYIEIPNSYTGPVPESYMRRQTLVNGERYITDELKDMESRILGARDRLYALEYDIFQRLREFVLQFTSRLQKAADSVAELDVYTSLATAAEKMNMTRPLVDESDVLEIREGRHIVVEKHLKNGYFIPNDCHMDCGANRMLLITGPNMAGKSTYMRQTAIILLLAQTGSFVPAASAHIGVADRLFTRVGAADDLASGNSTFMLEMSELAVILRNATRKSLVIYDEIGRGTSTFDGMSIAKAVVEYTVNRIGARALFATHYHELTTLEGELPGVVNYNITARKQGDSVIFLRRIARGCADGSYGIEVALLAGIPREVVDRAKEILDGIEAEKGVYVQRPSGVSADARTETVSGAGAAVLERIRDLSVETITPIEAMTLLYEMKKELGDAVAQS